MTLPRAAEGSNANDGVSDGILLRTVAHTSGTALSDAIPADAPAAAVSRKQPGIVARQSPGWSDNDSFQAAGCASSPLSLDTPILGSPRRRMAVAIRHRRRS